MPLVEVSQASCMSPGADLWVIPEREGSQLAQRLDWYLNFQIAKAAHHHSKKTSSEINSLLQECELPSYDWLEKKQNCLLLLSYQAFPNRWVMALDGSQNLENWVLELGKRWAKMNYPTMRIFLPENTGKTDFSRLWNQLSKQLGKQLEESQDVVKVGFVVDN